MDQDEVFKLKLAGGDARRILIELLQEMNDKRLLVHEVAADGRKIDRTDATKGRVFQAIEKLGSFTLPTPKAKDQS